MTPPIPVDAELSLLARRASVLESLLRETVRERDDLARRVADLEAKADLTEFIDLDDERWWRGEALEVLASRP